MKRRQPSRGACRRLASPLLVLAVAAGLLALVAACSADADDADDADGADGATTSDETDETDETADEQGSDEPATLVWGIDQEPTVLNPTITDGATFATSQVALAVLSPLWRITPSLEFEPLLLAGEPEVEEGPPFAVTYTLREDAVWSDGEPITAEDVRFTIEVNADESFDITSRSGFDQVDLEATEILDERTIRVVFDEPYAPWRTLMADAQGVVLPEHVLRGEDFDTVWDEELPVSSGPFAFDTWQEGERLVLTRNDNYWGEPAGLDRLVFRFLSSTDAQVQQLRGGEIDLMYPQPQLDVVELLERIDGVTVSREPGMFWEHLDFRHDVPGLDRRAVRQAIAMALDREQLVEQFIAPMAPDAAPLESLVLLEQHAAYEPHFPDVIPYDPEAAEQLLVDEGCERGEDGIFVCDGVRLSFDYLTTAENERRELTFELLQHELAEIGIELNADFREGSVVFSEDGVYGEDWELSSFAWSGAPDPADNVEVWRCGGSQNHHGHCDERASELLLESNRTLDPQRRMETINAAGRLLAEEVASIPLYQFPSILAWRDEFTGLADNPTDWGPVWNAGEWRPQDG